MADDFSLDDWGDDPFGGDMSFDSDFDEKKKGFISSVATGFLSGLKDGTYATSEGRLRVARMALPRSYGHVFDYAQELQSKKRDLMEELKNSSHSAVSDLQVIVQNTMDKYRERVPNKIADGLDKFSEKDFSDWEKRDYSTGDQTPTTEAVTDEEVSLMTLKALGEQTKATGGIGQAISETIAQVGGTQVGYLKASAVTLGSMDTTLRAVLNYQRKVQARNDAAKIDLLSRMYLTNAKYYKFMEAAMHRSISELKNISVQSAKSDFEKTSTWQTGKGMLRNKMLGTMMSRTGGLSNWISGLVGKNARQDSIGGLSSLIGDIRMGSEMSSGMDVNWGDMIGRQLANALIGKTPEFFRSGQGRKLVDRMKRSFPGEAARFESVYKRASKVGNVLSYGVSNGAGNVNSLLADNWHYEEDITTYEEYVQSLPQGKRPLPRAIWNARQKTKNFAGNRLNDVAWNINESSGTRFNLQKRSLSDMGQVSLWTRQSDRTLNEVIPGWFSKIHLTLEKMRTGDDSLEGERYDYRTGKFLNRTSTKKAVENQLFDKQQFSMFSRSSHGIVDQLDKSGVLSPEARNMLAFRLAQDVDKDRGFNPYNFIGLSAENGYSASAAKEIDQLMRGSFGITDDHIEQFQKGGLDSLKGVFNLPTDSGQELAANVSRAASSLKGYIPNVSNQTDLLRNAGMDDLLREMNIITTKDGQDLFNMDQYWDRFRQHVNGNAGNGHSDHDLDPTPPPPGSTRAGGFGGGPLPPTPNDNGGLINALNELKESLQNNQGGSPTPDLSPSMGEMLQKMDVTNRTLELIHLGGEKQIEILKALHEKGISQNAGGTPQSGERQESDRKSLLERLKGMGGQAGQLLKSGMDKVLSNQPLLLGGFLGGLGAIASHDPKLAALVGGTGALWMLYKRASSQANADEANDNQDLYTEDSEVPILESRKLKAGEYFDQLLKKVVTSWGQIKGAVVDTVTGTVVSAKTLAGKLFGPDGRAVVLKGLSAAKNAALKVFKFLDPLGKAKRLLEGGRNAIYQLDVYRNGDKNPTLTRKGFQAGRYFREVNGAMEVINGWNEIDGPVYDADGNQILTQEDVDNGLITSAGVKVDSLRNGLQRGGNALMGGLSRAGGNLKNRASGAFGKKDDTSGSQKPVVDRLDQIYALLCRQFGYDPVSGSGMPDAVRKMAEELGETHQGRANSLQDKEFQKKEAAKERFQDSVNKIAEELGDQEGDDKNDGKKDGKGFLGNLVDFMKNPLGMIGSLAGGALNLFPKFLTMGLKTLPMIAGGIAGLGKLLASLLTGKAEDAAGGVLDNLTEAAGEAGGGEEGEGRNRRRNRRNGRGGRRRRFNVMGGLSKVAKGVSIAGGASLLLDAGRQIMDVEEGSAADKAMNIAGAGANVVGGYTALTGAAGMLGYNMSLGGLVSAGYGGISAAGSAIGAAAPLIFNPITLGVGAVAGAGWLIYQYYAKGKGEQFRLRMAEYGIKDVDSDLAGKVRAIEEGLKDYVVVRGGEAAIANTAPLEKIFAGIAPDARDASATKAFYTWFNLRFKPVFLIYAAALDTAGFKSFEEFDRSTDPKIYALVSQVSSAISGVSPHPYMVSGGFDPNNPIIGRDETQRIVIECLANIRKYNDRHGRSEDGLVKDGVVKLKSTKETIEASENGGFLDRMKMRLNGTYQDHDDTKAIDQKFPIGKQVADIDVTDLLPGGDRPLDIVTSMRLAAYGNSDNIPWRCEAVLKLERYCEEYIDIIGKDARFKSTTGAIYNLFKNTFRLEDDQTGNWSIWFRDRFLPVCMEWVKFTYENRGAKPKAAWRSLSMTSKYNFGKILMDLKVTTGKEVKSLWNISASPFGKRTTSLGNEARAQDFMKNLETLATAARLKDPVAEAEKTSPQAIADLGNTRTMGQNVLNTKVANTAAPNDNIADLPQVNMAPVRGSTDTSMLDFSGVKQDNSMGSNPSVGNDKGVSVPQKAAEQLIMKEMMAAGFTDPRVIAEMLALANFESGGFRHTAENMNYRDPARLMKIFPSKIKSLAQAREVAAGGPPSIANAVYGGRMGNTGPNDGWLYRGRGFIQLTGHDNFAKASQDLGIDLINNPELVSTDPKIMAKTLVWYLQNNKRLQSIPTTGFQYAAGGLNPNGLPDMPARTVLYNRYLQQLSAGDLKPEESAAAQTPPGEVTAAGSPMAGANGEKVPSSATTPPPGAGPASAKDASGSSLAGVAEATSGSAASQGSVSSSAPTPKAPYSEKPRNSSAPSPLPTLPPIQPKVTEAPAPAPTLKPEETAVGQQALTNQLLAKLLEATHQGNASKAPDPRVSTGSSKY